MGFTEMLIVVIIAILFYMLICLTKISKKCHKIWGLSWATSPISCMYISQADKHVKIFDDRLEILSPGKLLSSISIQDLEELKGVHQSRNTYIARVLRESGYIRELGEGIKRIFGKRSRGIELRKI